MQNQQLSPVIGSVCLVSLTQFASCVSAVSGRELGGNSWDIKCVSVASFRELGFRGHRHFHLNSLCVRSLEEILN